MTAAIDSPGGISIIIVAFNVEHVLASCLDSILHAGERFTKKFEIIVVDNDSKDESVSFLRSDFPEITVIDNAENLGLAAGVNRGMKEASGEYYLILNPDMIALPGAVQTLTDFMNAHPDAGMIGGKLVSPNGKLQYSCYRFYRWSTILFRRTGLGRMKRGKAEIARFLMKDFDHESVRDVDWLMGACLMVRSKTVKEVGGMDERYFLYFEDVDWARRMWEAHWRVVYVPEARFSHFYQQSSRQGSVFGFLTNRVTREHVKSAFKYFAKFKGKTLPHSG